MNKVEFDNMKTDVRNVIEVDSTFERYMGDDLLFVSKEEFTHEEEGLDFKYKYVIEVIDLEEHTGDDGAIMVLELVVAPDSLHEEIREEIKETIGLEGTDYGVSYLDIKQYGLGVQMAIEEFEEFDLDVIEGKLDTLATLVPMVDSFRGFKLDNAWNLIGTTGWDTIRHLMFNENLFGF